MKRIVKSIILLAMLALAFTSCTKLKAGDTFVATENDMEFQFEVIVSKMNYVRVSPVLGPDMLSGEITIPSTVKYDGDLYVVTQVAKNAFCNCTEITAVNLPSTLTNIEEAAFQNCVSLTTINTPQPLSVIDDYAFDGCVKLEEFDLIASISTLGEACFRGCEALSDLEFPSTLMEIGDGAFAGCLGVRTVSMDRSVREIGESAFAGCSSIGEMTCLTATPPACDASTFEGVSEDILVTVPMASVESYRVAEGWNHFLNYTGVY